MTIKEALRTLKVYNTHDVLRRFAAKGRDVECYFTGTGDFRSMTVRHAGVYSPSHKTDPESAWYDYGQKTFIGKREESLPKAIAWATRHYDIREWAPCPLDRNAVIPIEVRERALAAAKAAQRGEGVETT